jgi:hypothetical protein
MSVTHQYGDERISSWLERNGYHPRSSKHGSASCLFLLDDLLHEREAISEAGKKGKIVYQEDYTVGSDDSKWNTDLVIGPPASDIQLEASPERQIVEAEPEKVWFAIDAKSVMTEHGKARRNRQRDINSFADIIHSHHPGAVTGGIILINMADRFNSPLRDDDDITEHDRIETLVAETIDIFRDIDRANERVGPNVDGVGCVVVSHTNIQDGEETHIVEETPAPQIGDIVQYEKFVEIIGETFENRWLSGERPDISNLVNVDIQAAANQQIIDLAVEVQTIGREINTETVSKDDLEALRGEITEIENIVDEIERRYL